VVKILLGIGNPLRGDDGVGVYIARHFNSEGWLSIDCGTVPENFTGVVRRHAPSLLMLVDAADMRIAPGEFRVVPKTLIEEVGIGTHSLPLTHLIRYLSPDTGEIIFVGIQPAILETMDSLSERVQAAAEKIIHILKAGDWQKIPIMEED